MILKRIALVGTSSVGKTTVFELLKNRLPKYEFISETTRTAKKYDFPINENGTNATQLAISNLHTYSLLTPYNLVLDRCYLDLVVYSKIIDNISPNVKAFIENTWHKVKEEYTHIIYFPIEFKAVNDGIRSINEEWRKEVDDMFKVELNKLNKKYLTVSGSPMQRVEQIMNFINND